MSTAVPASPGASAMPPEKRFPVVLLGFVGLSLLAHAATFFLFQVTYPPHVTIPPQPTQVTLLAGDRPEQQALLRWVESEDPALIAASAHPVPARLFETPYRPSYTTSRTAPRSMPIVPEPPARAPGPSLEALLRSTAKTSAATPMAMPRAATLLRFSPSLAARAPAPASAALHSLSSTPLEEATVLLGLGGEGDIRFCLLQKTSGDAATDAALLRTLQRLRFAAAPSSARVAWGFAYVSWGDGALPPSSPSK